eukprot:369987-Pyramimonas_sp.AAC.1
MSSYLMLDDDVGDGGVALVDVLVPGEEARVGGALRGCVLWRFFLAASEVPRVPLSRFCIAVSQNDRRGRPSARKAASRATISDSAEECNATFCFLHAEFEGKNAHGPTSATKTPGVDFDALTQSAKEASVKSRIEI